VHRSHRVPEHTTRALLVLRRRVSEGTLRAAVYTERSVGEYGIVSNPASEIDLVVHAGRVVGVVEVADVLVLVAVLPAVARAVVPHGHRHRRGVRVALTRGGGSDWLH
jgi:hypothetical protein